MTNKSANLFCSFCGRPQIEARLMILGCTSTNQLPSQLACICDSCVIVCVEEFLIPKGLAHLSGPRRMIADDIGVIA